LKQSLEGLNTLDVAQALGKAIAPQAYWLALDDEHGWLMLKREKPAISRLLDERSIGLQACSIYLGQHATRWVAADPKRDIAVARLPWGLEQRQIDDYWKYFFAPFPPPLVDGPIRLDTGPETITIEEIPRPAWAVEWARDRHGQYALAPNPWGPPQRVPFPRAYHLSPRPFIYSLVIEGAGLLKEAGLTLDLDGIGLLAALNLKVTQSQSFRYLPPTQFTMGSPPNEVNRDDDEGPQHQVTLTQGLWLADTACTQGLWLAVMGGKNPSHFTGDVDLPVENVSWDDVQTFLSKLQAFLPPGVEAVLPTEAEWEYACRAGGVPGTAFSFGDNINPSQVNYDGDFPYNGAAKGLDRRKTIGVKALPANDWGFFQMHGNVWEWCADAARTYTADAVVDPSGATGPDVKSFAVRGGSWNSNALYARSAQRVVFERDGRRDFLGFRFALRSKSQPGAGGPVLGGRSTPVLDVARDATNFFSAMDGKKGGKKSGISNPLAKILTKKRKP
jgi:formylglycine-generating enzyme required for sulfatase activity